VKQLMEALKSARRLEVCIAVAAIAVLLVLSLGGEAVPEESEAELRMQRILSEIEGAGRVSVMLSESESICTGAVIASSGADDISVMLQLQRAVRALTGLELEQIEIVKSGS